MTERKLRERASDGGVISLIEPRPAGLAKSPGTDPAGRSAFTSAQHAIESSRTIPDGAIVMSRSPLAASGLMPPGAKASLIIKQDKTERPWELPQACFMTV